MDFTPFPKIPRLDIIVTEKIDGTNAAVVITPETHPQMIGAGALNILAQSRKRFITPDADNYGFAAWVYSHADELLELGPGVHFGEWWGRGIQRGYGVDDRRFSLFNTSRWQAARPTCCGVVPVLYQGPFYGARINEALVDLNDRGSRAAPGFMNPEGVVVFHTASNSFFKRTLENDEQPKGVAN